MLTGPRPLRAQGRVSELARGPATAVSFSGRGVWTSDGGVRVLGVVVWW